MTNKLPEIGARYRNKKTGDIVNVTFERLRALTPPETVAIFKEGEAEVEMLECRFLIEFEPLPKEQDHISREGKKLDMVEEAKEELKKELDISFNLSVRPPIYQSLYVKAQNLVNALDSIKEGKTDMKEESVDAVDVDQCVRDMDPSIWNMTNVENFVRKEPVKKTEEPLPKSIWKDVSELEELQALVHHQNFSPELITYLEHILNQQEQNTKDIAEMKLKMEGK